ncbi:MAG: TetR/AcrR family transcriptional regulator [Bauldia litoralis]
MPASERRTLDRRIWIDAAIEVMAEHGVDAVKVEPLARRLGVTKGSFYWHFKDRSALLSALLDHWEDARTAATIGVVDSVGGGPAEKMRKLFEVSVADMESLRIEMAVRDWARNDQRAHIAVRAVDARRSVYAEQFFQQLGFSHSEARARGTLFQGLILSEALLVRDEEPEDYDARIEHCLELIMTPDAAPDTHSDTRRRPPPAPSF